MKQLFFLLSLFLVSNINAQDYFFENLGPFDTSISSPEEFLGYPIGSHHTRHDRIVSYFEELARSSERVSIADYGQTYGHRRLVMLTVTSPENHKNLERHLKKHLEVCDPNSNVSDFGDLPSFVNLAYNVHGNEPSGSEAALLTAYWLAASQSDEVKNYLDKAILMIDPTINPDGRDRHTHWANMYKGNVLVADAEDAEHNEAWPRGRTNHYWFDLNRDWFLGIHPESRGKLDWYHQWYPNVVTDFHEMGTNSTYFFEPMKANGSKDPIMPVENYTTLNEKFAEYYAEGLDNIGSLYFTKEVFDGTYPGYGSSYPDLQGGLGILFEQASSRGHLQETNTIDISFQFTIRNQFICSRATVQAAAENKDLLHRYQRDFFKSAMSRSNASKVKAYVFGETHDNNRVKAFLDKLILHRVKVYRAQNDQTIRGKKYSANNSYIVPTNQPQYRMVQSFFETYSEYTDSVFYDASAWSLANFYNMRYASTSQLPSMGAEITSTNDFTPIKEVGKSKYAYLIPWEDYNAPGFLYHLQSKGVIVKSAFRNFTIQNNSGQQTYNYGTLMVPVQQQRLSSEEVHRIILAASSKFDIPVDAVNTGYSKSGIDLGSRWFKTLNIPKVALLVGQGVSSYEAGEVWHLTDQRVEMPVTKIPMRNFRKTHLDDYNVLVMVSGGYGQMNGKDKEKLMAWVSEGNTLVTIREASKWVIKNKIVKDSLVEAKAKKEKERSAYAKAPTELGRERVGGAIFEVELDLTHPLAFGYHNKTIPVYRNSTVWLRPSKNPYSTVGKYSNDPHIDGFITDKNLNQFLKPSASLIVSDIGKGRAVMFADNPNFRGSWYGTNKLFLNALFLGEHIRVPKESRGHVH